MAKETIYLCNFRVSVEGDWLCLEELDDVHLETSIHGALEDVRDPMAVERSNLLDVFKLVVKELLDTSLSHGRMLDDTHAPLQQLFFILDHIFRHGIKPKKGILRDKRDFWVILQQVEKYTPDAIDITTSVREMPNIKTPLGRARAWLRLALMQKKLADYYRILVDHRDNFLHDFYEPGALMLDEEAHIISGLLVGLNVIDVNVGIKDENLDKPMGMIDFSLYLHDTPFLQAKTPMEMSRGSQQMAAILDQKNYLEELNRHLNATVTNLQQKLESCQTANTLMTEDITIAKSNIIQLQQENSNLRREKEILLDEHHRQMQTAQDDIDTERAAYQMSRQGLDTMYQDIQQRLQREIGHRTELEKQLEEQTSKRRELDMTLKLLEKDARAKQATVGALRRQLEDIKVLNQDFSNKIRTAVEGTPAERTSKMNELEDQTTRMAQVIQQMETRLAVVDKSNSKQGSVSSV